jgi:hypothetical protein
MACVRVTHYSRRIEALVTTGSEFLLIMNSVFAALLLQSGPLPTATQDEDAFSSTLQLLPASPGGPHSPPWSCGSTVFHQADISELQRTVFSLRSVCNYV